MTKLSSRVRFLKTTLTMIKMDNAQKALTLMIEEMSTEKGFTRADGKTPYYIHLVDVATKLVNFGIRDEITITAAILHDAIEDVDWISYEYVKREFGQEVADVVQGVTKDPNVDYKNNKDELIKYLQLCGSDMRMALVKVADRIHNFNTLGATALDKQLRVALETEEYFIPLFKHCRNEYPEYANFFFQAKTEIEPHLEKIKESAEREKALQDEIDRLNAKIAELTLTSN